MYTAIDILAMIFSAIVLVKILVILIKRQAWIGVVEWIYSKPVVTMLVSLVLALVSLNYLLNSVTIVQIFAVTLFISLLFVMTAAAYYKEIMPLARKVIREKRFMRKVWFPIVIWILLLVWALWMIFR